MRVVLFGRGGKVGQVLAPALEAAGHQLVVELGEAEAMVDFTAPDAVEANVRAALDAGVPCVVGTSGWDPAALGEQAASRGLPLFVAPNFALGAVVMMRLAAEAARFLPRAEIVELHNEAKKDAPSGTASATAELLGGEVPVHAVRLPKKESGLPEWQAAIEALMLVSRGGPTMMARIGVMRALYRHLAG